jgi:uncharacterized membrane protein
MLTMRYVYALLGLLFVGTAVLNVRARRWSMAVFWAIVAVPCLVGDDILAAAKAGTRWPAQAMGAGVLALAVLASLRRSRALSHADSQDDAAREASAARFGNRLFLPALAIPAIVLVLVVGSKIPATRIAGLLDPTPSQLPLVALGLAATLALIVALRTTRSSPVHGLTEARRLLDTIGWPVVLPTMLATLGAVFVDTGVGKAIAALVGSVIPTDSALACLFAFAFGMIAFTMITGNAFTAFPVLMAGIGLPLLVKRHDANPAALGAIGMLTGYCGTLLTPMAANFNIVPVLLLDLRSEYAVIRAQLPTAIAMIVANLALLILLALR